jgi:hypothetical protein
VKHVDKIDLLTKELKSGKTNYISFGIPPTSDRQIKETDSNAKTPSPLDTPKLKQAVTEPPISSFKTSTVKFNVVDT